ncbi:Cu(I)-responsive transcriptional regulator [Bacterioplanes sanyensis]|uniref:MerR family transcriptional regulator n=1 Tax=Bacterioplanes sanyensis TaxID=1249553 RepID=UPI00167A7D11|nr:MerR family transcriptional regulator [Bacterioplanes sanyensis]GGY35066.1 Cu(I)-responsive transcriptional regulator [Bacterioplanes sanyensis]
MRVQQLAKATGVSADTIRHYVRIDLLTPQKSDNGYHQFTAKDARRLRFIMQARQLGFTLDDIAQILAEAERGESPCPTVRQLIEPRLVEARARLVAMQQLVERMEMAVEQWQHQPDCHPCGYHICHLIEGPHEELHTEAVNASKEIGS